MGPLLYLVTDPLPPPAPHSTPPGCCMTGRPPWASLATRWRSPRASGDAVSDQVDHPHPIWLPHHIEVAVGAPPGRLQLPRLPLLELPWRMTTMPSPAVRPLIPLCPSHCCTRPDRWLLPPRRCQPRRPRLLGWRRTTHPHLHTAAPPLAGARHPLLPGRLVCGFGRAHKGRPGELTAVAPMDPAGPGPPPPAAR